MRRIHRNAAIILALLVPAGWMLYSLAVAVSILIGGLLAFLNIRWMTMGVDRLLGRADRRAAPGLAVRFVGRLVLIFLALFAMIHSSFFSVLGALAGLSVFVLAGMLEAGLLLFSREAGK